MAEPLVLDPRVEEILRDIAADPRAQLFAIDPAKFVRGLSESSVRASASATGLRSAERELLSCHRHEVARLFLVEFRMRLEEDPSNLSVHPYDSPPADERATRIREAADLQLELRAGDQVDARSLLRELVNGAVSHGPPDRARLLAASMRLDDSPTARVYLAYDHAARGEYRSAIRQAERVIAARASAEVLHTAWQASALSHERLGRTVDAIAHFETALDTAQQYHLEPQVQAVPALGALTLSLCVGWRSRVLALAARLDELVGVQARVLREAITIILKERQAGYRVRAATCSLARELSDRPGAASREVFHALN